MNTSSRLGAFLREELAPSQRRVKLAIRTALTATVATGVGIAGQLYAPVFAGFFVMGLLQTTVVCTFRNMIVRLSAVALVSLVLLWAAGILVDLAWLMVPVFFAAVATAAYFIPSSRFPIAWITVQYAMGMILFGAIFRPTQIGTTTLTFFVSAAVGIVSATVFSRFLWPDRAIDRLAESLGSSFDQSRLRLHGAAKRYFSPNPLADTAEPQSASTLADQLQLLHCAKQEGIDPTLNSHFLALITAAERIAHLVAIVERFAWERVGTEYRQRLRPQLESVLITLDHALDSYAKYATAGFAVRSDDNLEGAPEPRPWPGLDAKFEALEERHIELRGLGLFRRIDLAEAANGDTLMQVLRDLATVVHTTPDRVGDEAAQPHRVEEPIRTSLNLKLDPDRVRFALKVGLAATLAFVIGAASQHEALKTTIFSCVLVAGSSYGFIVRKAGLRLIGAAIGGIVALLLIVALMPNLTSFSWYLVAIFVVILPGCYVALGGPRVAYAGYQAVLSFLVCFVALRPMADVYEPLWRVFTILLGVGIVFVVFRYVWPDYAGRQLVRRFIALYHALLECAPGPDVATVTVRRAQVLARQVPVDVQNILRLADEARMEGKQSGVDPNAAVAAAGAARRTHARLDAISFSWRSVARPAYSADTQTAIDRVERTTRDYLLAGLRVLEVHERGSLPFSGSDRTHREASFAPPELEAALQAFADRLTPPSKEAYSWPADVADAVLGELEHYRRLAVLLPQLHETIVRMLLPASDARAEYAWTAHPETKTLFHS